VECGSHAAAFDPEAMLQEDYKDIIIISLILHVEV
jgi:hypothetical protein